MDFETQRRSFSLLGGQSAPQATDGIGIQALYRCPVCQRIWLQDGKSVIMDVSAEQAQRAARTLSADLAHLPAITCRFCLWRAGHGSIEIDEYDQGEGFGFCWELPRPVVIHAVSAMLSRRCAQESSPDVLTRREKLRAVLRTAITSAPPRQMQSLDPVIGRLQALKLRPGFGQPGTENWCWQGYHFVLACPPLDEVTTVTLMVALPASEPLSEAHAFRLWQTLLRLALRHGIPATGA